MFARDKLAELLSRKLGDQESENCKCCGEQLHVRSELTTIRQILGRGERDPAGPCARCGIQESARYPDERECQKRSDATDFDF